MHKGEFTNSTFIRRLESLYLLARKVLGGTLQADRKSTRKGAGVTFADYAEYNHGDDYRAIDWRVYARFDELVIKLFELEEDATIYLLCDCSHSMASKQKTALELSAALGYIALNCQDRLAAYSLSDKLEPIIEPTRGRAKVLPFLKALEQTKTHGEDTHFTRCIKSLQARHRKRGMVIVISDFLFPRGYEEGLKLLQWHGHDVFCLQVHDPKDLQCDWKGDLQLECIETGQNQKVTITKKEAEAYNKAMADWNDQLRKECAKRGIGLGTLTSEHAFDQVISNILKRGGLVA
ncbi:DUF58 domain-containing protein [Persicirhabdus sediminis]|uniref:DUF58 domain-containing protein n=1 Tax=Persicirhabdus sediminis TaxID=454144 RepID=A0A8J7SLS6_9BACT|nr:DUF58 domain-containing protein [Persicirhabdus sediminis]MBK1790608.1 DUF58 domain-containing protein [Persicirhabdus sediminis]